jgi:hypothetical protein
MDAYNGKNPRLGIILEGVNNKDFLNARLSVHSFT